MSVADFFGLSLGLQTALGAGYLAYATAYVGLRRDHKTEDTLFISLAFSSIAFLVFGLVSECCGAIPGVLSAFVSSLVAAAVWRRYGRGCWLALMKGVKVHRDDGLHSTWAAIVQSGRDCGQISVHLKDKTVLYMNDRQKYHGTPWDGLYLGGDGSIVLAVEEEDLPDGKTEIREDVVSESWGTRLTYVPSAEITRINIRLK